MFYVVMEVCRFVTRRLYFKNGVEHLFVTVKTPLKHLFLHCGNTVETPFSQCGNAVEVVGVFDKTIIVFACEAARLLEVQLGKYCL